MSTLSEKGHLVSLLPDPPPQDTYATVTRATATLQLNRQSNRSWRSAGEEELDPFAGLEDEFEFTDDLEANLLRDKKATLCASVSDAVEKLQSDKSSIGETCDDLVCRYAENAIIVWHS